MKRKLFLSQLRIQNNFEKNKFQILLWSIIEHLMQTKLDLNSNHLCKVLQDLSQSCVKCRCNSKANKNSTINILLEKTIFKNIMTLNTFKNK